MRRLETGLALAGAAASVVAFCVTGMFDRQRAILVGVYVALGLAAFVAAWCLRWCTKVSLTTCLAAVWVAALCWFVGAAPVVATIVVVAAARAVGAVCMRTRSLAIDVVGGLAVIAGLTGWVLTLPVHVAWVWWTAMLVIALSHRHLLLRDARWQWRRVVRIPWAPALVMGVGLMSTACWLPNVQSDDLAYHLSLPTQLLEDAVYRPNVDTQLWAYAPWANDTLHGIVAMLSGRVAHGALNAGWLALVAASAWRLVRACGLSGRPAMLAIGAALSIPMVGGLATGMHTELPATAVSLALCALAFDKRRAPLLAIALLGGGLFALKAMHGFAALPVLVVAIVRHAREDAPLARVFPLGAFLGVGASSYVFATLATGDALYPLGHIVDTRWQQALELDAPFALFFDTERYLEAGRGALGIAAFSVAGVAAVGMVRKQWTAPLLATASMIVLPFAVVHYARYVLPGVVCFTVVAAAMLHRLAAPKPTTAVLTMCIALQCLLWPTGNWILSTRALAHQVGSGGDADLLIYRRFVPELAVLSTLPSNVRVLATNPEAPYVAMFGARGRSTSWYAPALQSAARDADADLAGARWGIVLRDTQTGWVLTDDRRLTPALAQSLHALKAQPHATEGHATLWRLHQP